MRSESMQKIAKFYKVSYEQFEKDSKDIFQDKDIKAIYDGIKLPKRATKGSAGYDFYPEIYLYYLFQTVHNLLRCV